MDCIQSCFTLAVRSGVHKSIDNNIIFEINLLPDLALAHRPRVESPSVLMAASPEAGSVERRRPCADDAISAQGRAFARRRIGGLRHGADSPQNRRECCDTDRAREVDLLPRDALAFAFSVPPGRKRRLVIEEPGRGPRDAARSSGGSGDQKLRMTAIVRAGTRECSGNRRAISVPATCCGLGSTVVPQLTCALPGWEEMASSRVPKGRGVSHGGCRTGRAFTEKQGNLPSTEMPCLRLAVVPDTCRHCFPRLRPIAVPEPSASCRSA